MSGWVYLMANDAMPRLYKIGMTVLDPRERAMQLSASSGAPSEFAVLIAVRVPSPLMAERGLHDWYRDARPNDRREFFAFSTREELVLAIDTIRALAGATLPMLHDDLGYWVSLLPEGRRG